MAKTLQHWLETDVAAVSETTKRRWLCEEFFFRDPVRPMYTDLSYFFAPADGVIIYQQRVQAAEPLVDIKGKPYSLRDAMRSPHLEGEYLVIGIFMTLYDVHINRIPYAGYLKYRSLPSLETNNRPMLPVEAALLDGGGVWSRSAQYLHSNQRMLNRIVSSNLRLSYHILQIADYDVCCILPFELTQNSPVAQNMRFSQVRFGSQVDLILPIVDHLEYQTLQNTGMHVEAGVDPLVKVSARENVLQCPDAITGQSTGGPTT